MFGLSGSKSSSQSTGSSQASSFSFGGSQSTQGSQSGSIAGGSSVSGDQALSGSSQSIAFEDVFARLFGSAEGVAGNLDTSLLTEASNQLFSGGVDFLKNLGGDVGSQFLADRLNGSNDVLNAQLGQLQGDIGQLFREELNPAITSEAVAGGQLGGGRQGVAQGKALDASADAFARGATELRTADQAQRDAIASGVADRNIQGTQVGLAGLPGLLEIVGGGINAQTMPLEFLASILGPQQALTESFGQSSGFSSAMDFARAFSESFGQSSAFDRAGSQSTSETQSTSSSKSFGIGF